MPTTTTSPRPISQKGEDLIKEFEGYEDRAYQDEKGVWTIGWGHTRGVKPGVQCTVDQATRWFWEDIEVATHAIEKVVHCPLNPNQLAALISFQFNTGGLHAKRCALRDFLNQSQYELAAKEFPRWNKVWKNGAYHESRGLTRRRKREMELFLEPYNGN